MNNIKSCQTCGGLGLIYPLGGIEKECRMCKGIGKITHAIIIDEPKTSPSIRAQIKKELKNKYKRSV